MFQDIDAFEAVRLDAVIVDVQPEAIEELQSLEATDQSVFSRELPFAEVAADPAHRSGPAPGGLNLFSRSR